MGSSLVLVLAGLASIASVLLTTAVMLLRTRSLTLSLCWWLIGWSALFARSIVALLSESHPEVAPLRALLGTLVTPCMLLGALAYMDRPRPRWLYALTLGLAVTRAVATAAGFGSFSATLAMTSEPAIAFGGALVLLDFNRHLAEPRSVERSNRILAAGFVLLGCTEFFEAVTRTYGATGWANGVAWLAVGVPLFTAQVGVHLARNDRAKHRNEEELGELSTRLDLLFRAASECLVETDDRGVIRWVQASPAAMGGLLPANLVGRNILELLDPTSSSQLSHRIAKNEPIREADVERVAGATHLICLPDGSHRWFEFFGSTRRTPCGELRIVARMRDVTARVEREQSMGRNEAARLRSERIAGVGSWEADLASRRFVLSPEMYRIYGLDPAVRDLSFEKVAELFHPEDRASAWDQWRAAIAEGSSTEITHRIVRPSDGVIRTVRMVVETDRDETGKAIRMVGSSMDVTEQVALTTRLRRGQRRLQALIDSNFVSVFVAHRDGTILEANDAFLARLGYSKQDLPLDWRVLTAPEDRAADERRVALVAAPDQFGPFEKSFLDVRGERVPMMLACGPIDRDSSILVGTDLTERKRTEAERARHQRELERTVATRTRELLESRNRLAEHERLAAVGTLAAGVAHQINNPVGAIANCAEYALLCRDDADAFQVFERALHDNLAEARRCGQIVRSMLQFSRDQPTAKWIEDLSRVARRAHRAIEAYAKDRGATVTFETSDEALLARVSPIEVEQAIVNVLRNAIESRDDGVQVSIVLARRDKSAVIEIADDGHGIQAEHQDHLFEPFFSTRTREGGTGLGLSVAHGVLVDHGGSIQVESIPGCGTRVVMTVPLAEGTEDPGPRRASGGPS